MENPSSVKKVDLGTDRNDEAKNDTTATTSTSTPTTTTTTTTTTEEEKAENAALNEQKKAALLRQYMCSATLMSKLSLEQMYRYFFMPVVKKFLYLPDSADARRVLLGEKTIDEWLEERCKRFVGREREETSISSISEKHIRELETRIALELCYRGNVRVGLKDVCSRLSGLENQINVERVDACYVKTTRSFEPPSFKMRKTKLEQKRYVYW